MNRTRILIFAKAPLPGQAKTRLIPALGAAGAARLARLMLEHTLRHALAADIGPVELCASPAPTLPEWADVVLPVGVESSSQGEGDLGARLERAAQRCLDRGERVVLIGSDCPALCSQYLREAVQALDHHDAVIHPCLDGGYVLLSLRATAPGLFTDLPWSTDQVFTLTLARLHALQWRVRVAVPLPDIDVPADLVHLPEELCRGIVNIHSGATPC